MRNKILLFALLVGFLTTSCVTINPGEVGVISKRGKIKDKIYEPGRIAYNPFNTVLYRVPTRTVNLEVRLALPSKEGLNVNAEISILYRIKPSSAIKVVEEVGMSYENTLILSVFRSKSADICAEFLAKDMHSGNRQEIEEEILIEMNRMLADRGFEIEAVLMKSISLPEGLYTAIESKLSAEQEAQRMQFVLDRERAEAERKLIEAEGIKNAQMVLTEGLNENVIQWRSLEVFENLSNSPNAKVIITNSETPVLLNQ